MKMSKTIGLINGGGTGAELIACVIRCLDSIKAEMGLSFQIEQFDNKKWQANMDEEKYHPGVHAELLKFYNHIQSRQGAIVRGSLPAPILYRLRRDLQQSVKLLPLNPFPALSIHPEFRAVLIREGSQGIYHYSEMSRSDAFVEVRINHDIEKLSTFASQVFRIAELNGEDRVTTILKTSVLGELGLLWLEIFRKESERHPSIQYVHRPSGAGFSDMWLEPGNYKVIATDDQGGDIISDLVPTVLYGSRNLVPAGNFSVQGHHSYQTDHGTIKPLEGKNEVNPCAMIGALAMAFRYTFNMLQLADAFNHSIEKALTDGYRTADMCFSSGHKSMGTVEMTEKVIENLNLFMSKK
jgi:3-isopropylmalate dehydrogenase